LVTVTVRVRVTVMVRVTVRVMVRVTVRDLNMKGKNMKRLVKVEEVEGEGLIGFMGERITLCCQIYIYTGKLVGVNTNYVLLEDASVVYLTGDYKDKFWADAQPLPNGWYVMTNDK
jgi:hypothetical protein